MSTIERGFQIKYQPKRDIDPRRLAMPLLDHFHPPLSKQRHWDSFHGAWAEAIARHLNEDRLPAHFYAEARVMIGSRVEIDVATHEETNGKAFNTDHGGVAVWAPPKPITSAALDFAGLDLFEVQIFNDEEGPKIVAAIELVSPANKDRAAHRQAFAIKCASYLCQGISLIVIDIVTTRRVNLHNEIMRLLGHGQESWLPAETSLYGVAYRPVVRNLHEQIEVWPSTLNVGQRLPLLPLLLDAEKCLPIDLEASYTIACQRRRLA
jgi:hypothetical protein